MHNTADAAAQTATIRLAALGTLDFWFMNTLLQVFDNDVMDCSRFEFSVDRARRAVRSLLDVGAACRLRLVEAVSRASRLNQLALFNKRDDGVSRRRNLLRRTVNGMCRSRASLIGIGSVDREGHSPDWGSRGKYGAKLCSTVQCSDRKASSRCFFDLSFLFFVC